jgi:hypothetical protein
MEIKYLITDQFDVTQEISYFIDDTVYADLNIAGASQ